MQTHEPARIIWYLAYRNVGGSSIAGGEFKTDSFDYSCADEGGMEYWRVDSWPSAYSEKRGSNWNEEFAQALSRAITELSTRPRNSVSSLQNAISATITIPVVLNRENERRRKN